MYIYVFWIIRMINYCMIRVYSLLVLLLGSVLAGSIVSNIPVIVSPVKNYTSTSPQWLTSPYFRANNEAVIKVLTGNSSTPTYTFTYSSALPGLPNLAYGIKNYRGNDYLGQEFYEIKKIGLTATTFKVSIQIYGVTNLWLLTVAYLAVDPTFPHHLNTFDNVPVNYTAGDIVNITSSQPQLTYYTNYINYTEQADGMSHTKFTTPYSSNNIVLFMTSFWVRGSYGTFPSYYPVKFHISTGIVNESFYFWNVTLEKHVIVTNVHFSQIIFNTDDVLSSKKYFIVYETWTNDMNGGFIEIPEAFIDNFIMGVTAFETVDSRCGFEYQWEYTNATVNGKSTFGVELLLSWTLTNTCGFAWSLSSIFYMQTWLCPPPFYYFNLTSGLCQTLCGGFTYENIANFTCDPCVNTLCYSCDNPTHNLCTDCASYLFYELVNGVCACMGGYFRANSVCMPCNGTSTGCLTCSYNDGANGTLPYNSNLFVALTCNNTANYFVSGALCRLCTLSNCLVCLNLTACTTCTATYFPSVALTCVHCYVTGCAYCTTNNSNACAICNLTMGYYLNNNQTCITKCGDGIIVSGVQQCDDNNTVSYDGCSSACALESSFSCTGAPSVCYFASSTTISLSNTIIQPSVCDTITFTFQITPTTATFSQSYIIWTDFIVAANTSLIKLNTSMVKYSSGKVSVSYFMRVSIQNLTLLFTTNFTSLMANSSIFSHTTSNALSFAVVPTNNRSALLECCTGYYLIPASDNCSEICGDGLLFYLPCDDGNLANGDGCSSTCQIETDYVCLNGSTTNSSVCCFNGSVAVSVNSAIKDPGSNTLSISYTVSPMQPVLNLINNSYNFLPYVSLSNPAATVVSAIYDPATNTVNVQVSYNQSIQGQALDLTFTPPRVPSASLLPPVGSSWKVAPNNHLSASYYPESTYSQVKKLQPYSSAVLGIYLSVSLITFFFRKFIGLELATLIQIGYLSLVMNNQLPAYLQSLSTWQYVFGYNYFYLSKSASTPIDSAYSLYGYQKYFGYSCNVMVLAIATVYGLSLILVCLSAITTKTLSRKLRNGGFILLNEVGFALVTFSTPNIVTAICIEVSSGTIFDTSVFWSKAFLCMGAAAILVSNMIALVNADDSSDVGTFFRKHSNLGIYAPLLFSLRLILLTVFLFVNDAVGSLGSYILLTVQSVYVVFVMFGRPHKKPYDFVRGLVLELSLLYILLTRYLETAALNKSVNGDSMLFEVLSIMELAAYGLGVLISVVSLVYHLVKRFKKNKVQPQPNDNLLEEASPDKIRNSSAKLDELSKDGLREGSPSKRKINDQNASSIVFDIEDMDAETNEVPGTTGPSQFKFDPRKQERKYRRRR